MKISLDGSPQDDIYPPTFAQQPPKINETIRKMLVQWVNVALTAVAAMSGMLYTGTCPNAFRPGMLVFFSELRCECEANAELERPERDFN